MGSGACHLNSTEKPTAMKGGPFLRAMTLSKDEDFQLKSFRSNERYRMASSTSIGRMFGDPPRVDHPLADYFGFFACQGIGGKLPEVHQRHFHMQIDPV
jgi:hypothetical protein